MTADAAHRLLLAPAVAERLLARAGVRAPWPTSTGLITGAATRAVRRLGPLPGLEAGWLEPPACDLALARLGALVGDPAAPGDRVRLHPRLAAGLAPLRTASVQVRVDLAVAPAGPRLRSWQFVAPDAVVALSTTGAEVQVGWHDRAVWPGQLAAIPAAVPPAPFADRATQPPAQPPTQPSAQSPDEAPAQPPARPDRVPAELLVATGAALEARRPDLFAELTRSLPPGLDPQHLARLHRSRARLRVLVTGPGRAGCLGWVLLPGGWHELSPRDGEVHLTPTVPDRLGPRVQRLVDGAVR